MTKTSIDNDEQQINLFYLEDLLISIIVKRNIINRINILCLEPVYSGQILIDYFKEDQQIQINI